MTAVLISSSILAGILATFTIGRRWRDARLTTVRRRRAARELPGAVSAIARSVRSGSTLEVAMQDVAPSARGVLGQELRGAVRLLELGHGTARVLELWRRATVVDGVVLLVAACRFSLDHGAGLVGSLDGVAQTLLDRIEVMDETAALAAQAKTSTMALIMVPPIGMLLFALIQPSFLGVLVGTTPGRICLLTGVGLELLGARIATALVRHAVSDGGGAH